MPQSRSKSSTRTENAAEKGNMRPNDEQSAVQPLLGRRRFLLAQLDWRRFQLVAIFGGVGRRPIMIIPASALPRPLQRRRLVRFT